MATKISALTAAGAAGGTEVFPVVQSGATKKMTLAQVLAYIQAGNFSILANYANDAAAATGGIPVGGLYRNGSVVMVRVA